jgi:hypothetical protein
MQVRSALTVVLAAEPEPVPGAEAKDAMASQKHGHRVVDLCIRKNAEGIDDTGVKARSLMRAICPPVSSCRIGLGSGVV